MLPRSVTRKFFRGADAFKYGALTFGGAINLVPFTG
jgi:outer membrane receptor for Fe3+-dicitrate